MGLGKSKPKKPDAVSASGRSSTAWGDADGHNRGRGQSNPRVARPNLQQFKSSSAPSSRDNVVRNGASSNRSGHNNNNNNWANDSNTSYNLLDGTVSHASDDFRTIQINRRAEPDRRRLSGGGGNGGSDKFANFRGMTDYRKQDDYVQKRNEDVNAPKNPRIPENTASRNPRAQETVSKKKPRWRSPSPPKELSPKKGSQQHSHHRRHSDISTLELEASPPTRPEPFRRVPHGKPKFSESYDERDSRGGGGGPNNARERQQQQPRRRAVSSSPPSKRRDRSPQKKGRSPPQPQPAKKPPPKRSTSSPTRGGKKTSSVSSRYSNGGNSNFTNIGNVKSAASVAGSTVSAVSNFGTRTKVEKFNDKRESLRLAKLSRIEFVTNQFADQRVLGPQTYDTARQLTESDDWEKEVKGLEMIVAIARDSPELLRTDMKTLIRLMIAELKNLRSQVSRAAGQAMAELFLNLGTAMEMDLEKTTPILLQRAADTNKFIRESCNEALDVMVENVTVLRAMQAIVASGGLGHKSVVVKTNVARLVDKVVTQLGAERVMGSSKEFQEIVIGQGSKQLTDGSQDVRRHSRHYFGELAGHQKFQSVLKEFVSGEAERKDVMKALGVKS